MPNVDNPDDRFGVPEALISETHGEHAMAGLMRVGCYVPTRKEVATMEPGSLTGILENWFWESPSELIPSDEQEGAVLTILKARPDANAFRNFIIEAEKPHVPQTKADKTDKRGPPIE